jgi:FecR protein
MRISTVALSALLIVGASARAQEPMAPVSSGADVSAASDSQTTDPPTRNSKIRIVRLSEVKGEVQLDRQTGKGFESAMANLPVVEGEKLKTGNGVAEVEFEDNSTVRLAQNSLVEFPRLELLPSGAKASSVTVMQGMVYVSLVNTKGNEFTVNMGPKKINLPPDSHVRLQLTPNQASLAVLHGQAQVEAPSGITTLDKNQTMTFTLAGESQPVIAKNVSQEPLDSWDRDAVQYHKSFANASSYGNAPYAYGINDLNYYGSFASGCGGSMWRPYFAGASWNPYGSGAWAYYPSAGYSWVSPYPWGWTPYHYGSWAFCQGIGWGWRPGGSWMGLANNSSPASTLLPHPPSHAPLHAESTLLPVNMKAIPASGLTAHDTFIFRADSAGMGVPRGSLGKLNGFSGEAAHHGAATANVFRGGSPQRGVAEGGAQNGNSGPASALSARSASSLSSSSGMQGPSEGGASRASAGSSGGGGKH